MFQSYNDMHFNIGGRRKSYNVNFGGRGKAMIFFSLIVTGVVRFPGDDWFVFRAMQWPSHSENFARPQGTKGRWRLRQSRAATAQGQSAAGRVGYDGPCKFNRVVDANRHSHMHV